MDAKIKRTEILHKRFRKRVFGYCTRQYWMRNSKRSSPTIFKNLYTLSHFWSTWLLRNKLDKKTILVHQNSIKTKSMEDKIKYRKTSNNMQKSYKEKEWLLEKKFSKNKHLHWTKKEHRQQEVNRWFKTKL